MNKYKKYFDNVVDGVFLVILLMLIVALIFGSLNLLMSFVDFLRFEGITGQYINFIADVLTLYVLIELSRSLVEYFEINRIRLTFIVDAAIVFIIRELLIGIFKEKLSPDYIYAFAAILFVLGALRIASIVMHHKEKQMV